MKKTFTLLSIAMLLATGLFAQQNGHRGYRDGNDNDYAVNNDWRGRGDRSGYYFTDREKDMQIRYINREYHGKIQSVKHRWFMGRERKQQVIWSLEQQRQAEIRAVYAKFNDPRNRYGRRDNRRHDHDRRNW